ncbi:hypothetical protein IH922_08380 [candidate division KSB1 bacterium]|nr:hypothetical protein [candidate division KSB1 bacterium]
MPSQEFVKVERFIWVSHDGQRFLLLKPIEESSTRTQLNVVTNWFEELKHKVAGVKS